jgi:hypothetical protein
MAIVHPEIEHIGSSIGVLSSFVVHVCRICGGSGTLVIPYGSNGREMHSCEDHIDNVTELASKAKNFAFFDAIFYDRKNRTYSIRLSNGDIRQNFSPIEMINQGIYYNSIDGKYYVFMCNVENDSQAGWCLLSQIIEINPELSERLTDRMRAQFLL